MSDPRDIADAHVLGLLDEAAAADVERRISALSSAEDIALRDALLRAQDRLLPLDLTAAPVPLSAGAWDALTNRLDVEDAIAAPRVDSRPATRAGRTQSARTANPLPTRRPAGRPRPSRWRWAALGGVAASIALAATLAWRVLVIETPAVVAVLLNDTGRAVALVEAFEDDSVLIIPLESVAGDVAGTFQVWTKPDPEGPPVSVGLLEELRRIRIQGPDLPSPSQDQLYEITIEPEGGSPTGLPTGPIVGKGLARRPL